MAFATHFTYLLQNFTKIGEVRTEKELTARAAEAAAMAMMAALAVVAAVCAAVAMCAHAMVISTASPVWVTMPRSLM